jgi:cysteine desulfurase/selenocysteine lyase
MSYDVYTIRSQFPILETLIDGEQLVYLDNGATSQKPLVVLEAMTQYYTEYNSNVHRGVHTLSNLATNAYEQARQTLASFVNAPSIQNIIFTKNATEAINTVAAGWARHQLQPGDEIVISILEHHSNILPWQQLCQEKGCTLKYWYTREDQALHLEDLEALLTPQTKLVSITALSNVTGYITPIYQVGELCKQHNIAYMLDACQWIAHKPFDVQAIGCDFAAWSAHKMCGPTGIGALYVSPSKVPEMKPYQLGGGTIAKVTEQTVEFAQMPEMLEAGTPMIAEAIGFTAALNMLSEIGMDTVAQYEYELTQYAVSLMMQIPKLQLIKPMDAKFHTGILSFTIPGLNAYDIGSLLNTYGIAIRTGHHCAQPLLSYLGIDSVCRASLALYNTQDDVDAFVEALDEIVDQVHTIICVIP